jgi:hypothetical protein
MYDTNSQSDRTEHSDSTTAGAPGRRPLTGVLQRKGSGGTGANSQEVAASGFTGSTMALPYRAEMEQGFGVSFSNVQVYGGGAAADAASQLNAEAYTVGQQVAFKDTNPAPAIVAHELAHTLQQGDAGPVQTWAEGAEGDAFEAEANDAAATVLAGGTASVSLRTGPTISKWGGSDHYTIGNLAGSKALQLFAARFPGRDPGVPQVPVQTAPGMNGAPIGGGIQQGGPNGTIVPAANQTTIGVGTNTGQLTMGGAARFGGDYNTTVAGMAERRSDLGNSITEAPVGAGGGNWVSDKVQFAQMAIGGTTNSNHFFPVNGQEYRNHHNLALGHARAAYAAKQRGDDAAANQLMQEAMQEEGFGAHFLQDTFAAGHMAPRSLDSTEHLVGEGANTLAKTMHNVASGVASGVGGAVGAVTGTAGAIAGGVVGAVGGFASAVGDWFGGTWTNPFSAAADGAVETGSEWGQAAEQVGSGIGSAVTNAALAPMHAAYAVQEAPGFLHDAAEGLLRTKQWHDYFCALPNGLPTTRGRFHGDYFMDGTDLEVVSETCANSIFNVLAAAQGAAGNMPVDIPTPDFAGIMADPQAGPVWRMMMQDYSASLEAARRATAANPGATHTTDGGTTMSSQEIYNQIYNVTFGGAAGIAQADASAGEGGASATALQTVTDAQRAPIETINAKRVQLRGALDGVGHYASTHFGYNAALAGGAGLNDDMNAPDPATAHNPDVTGFDPVQIEATFGLYSNLARVANEFALAAQAGSAAVSDPGRLTKERELAAQIATSAQSWATRARALAGATDAVSYGMGHGTISSGRAERVQLRADVRAGLAAGNGHFTADFAQPAQAGRRRHRRAG